MGPTGITTVLPQYPIVSYSIARSQHGVKRIVCHSGSTVGHGGVDNRPEWCYNRRSGVGRPTVRVGDMAGLRLSFISPNTVYRFFQNAHLINFRHSKPGFSKASVLP